MIKILIDSTADLPFELLKKHNIDIIPLVVRLGDTEYLDKQTITVDELYQYLREGNFAQTSQPNPQITYDILNQFAKEDHALIVLTISAKLSGTYQTIHMVKEQLKETYPDLKIEVIDSKGGSGIPAIMALQAALLNEQNHSFEEIVDNLKEMANCSEHIFTIDNLKYLMRSGRVNKAEALIGNLLHIKPILHVVDGEIKFYAKTRGMRRALDKIADIVEERIKAFPKQIIGIMHADDLETANRLKEKIFERIGEVKVVIDKIGSALGTHLGIGGVGVFFFNKKPDLYIY